LLYFVGSELFDAVNCGDLVRVREDVYECNPDINRLFAVNRDGERLSPLMLACTRGNVEMTKLLLRHDAVNVSMVDGPRCACVYVSVNTSMHVFACVCVYDCTGVCYRLGNFICTGVEEKLSFYIRGTYARLHTIVYTHTHTHTHTHTYT
jgi:hypothetical protein